MLIFFRNDDCVTEPIFQSNGPPFLEPADEHSLKLLVAVVRRDGRNRYWLPLELLAFYTMGVIWNRYGSRFLCRAAGTDSKDAEENRKMSFHWQVSLYRRV